MGCYYVGWLYRADSIHVSSPSPEGLHPSISTQQLGELLWAVWTGLLLLDICRWNHHKYLVETYTVTESQYQETRDWVDYSLTNDFRLGTQSLNQCCFHIEPTCDRCWIEVYAQCVITAQEKHKKRVQYLTMMCYNLWLIFIQCKTIKNLYWKSESK
jgi:hypothetical protein